MLQYELRIITIKKIFLENIKQLHLRRRRNRVKKTYKKEDRKHRKIKREDEFESFKTLEDLNDIKHDEMVENAKIELELKRLGVSKISINFFKKSIIPKKYLHLVNGVALKILSKNAWR